jgi:hypothetical protein
MKFRPTCLLVALLALAPAGAGAQNDPAGSPAAVKKTPNFGAALSMKYPYESFGDEYHTGYGIHAIMDYPFIPLLDLTADVGWNRFPKAAAGESIDIWEFVGGARVRLGVFFMSGEVGYYTNIKATSFLPGMGLRFTRFEAAVNIRAVPGGSWTGLRFGYYF